MAIWETTSSVVLWASNGSVIKSAWVFSKITDENVDETVLEASESVKVTWGNSTFEGTFLGTVNLGGVEYPVVRSVSSGNRYILGVGNVSNIPSTLAESELNTSNFTVCFFPGTLIAIPGGECEVEQLASGDLVMVGDTHAVPVKWIGLQSVSTLFGPAERLMPVRIAAGSLGGGGGGQPLQPHSDLTVTADHAMLVDGVLCEAGALVNGTTISRVPLSEFGGRYTVYHVETEAHEIILANGAPAETFVDNASRRAFDNFSEFEALHGDTREMKELPYPRASNARHLPARIKARLGLDLPARRPRRSAS